jgi:hypothetical protein
MLDRCGKGPTTKDRRWILSKADLLLRKKVRVALRVEELIEEGYSTESAVSQVMQERSCSRSSIFAAMRESKKHPDLMIKEKHYSDVLKSTYRAFKSMYR